MYVVCVVVSGCVVYVVCVVVAGCVVYVLVPNCSLRLSFASVVIRHQSSSFRFVVQDVPPQKLEWILRPLLDELA